MKEALLAALSKVSVKLNGRILLHPLHLLMHRHEQWAIIGASGSGKTTLAKALAGKIFYHGNIHFHPDEKDAGHAGVLLIGQQHHFKNRSNTSDLYYQQRYNSMDAEDTVTVAEALEGPGADDAVRQRLTGLLHLTPLLQKPLIQLSNGENKRLQLAKALLRHPAVLIMDNPFVGLDKEGRKTLSGILEAIVADGIHIILITSPDELPACITHVAVLEKGHLTYAGPKKEVPVSVVTNTAPGDIDFSSLLQNMPALREDSFETAVKMKEVTVRYGEKIILQRINWEVKRGECWSISGPNGSGKSTLLSLITADNPQAYANQVWLFDRRRGSGESIWDIKRRIGFVSPELHLFFDAGTSCFDVVASGLFDTIGLFRQLSAGQQQQVNAWLELTGLQDHRNTSLSLLSLGQQRMVLLARALVKNPPLLILDEPCQGLDTQQTHFFTNLVDQLCRHFQTTLLYVSHYEKDIPGCVKHSLKLDVGSFYTCHPRGYTNPGLNDC